jgi:hypothetical protein
LEHSFQIKLEQFKEKLTKYTANEDELQELSQPPQTCDEP